MSQNASCRNARWVGKPIKPTTAIIRASGTACEVQRRSRDDLEVSPTPRRALLLSLVSLAALAGPPGPTLPLRAAETEAPTKYLGSTYSIEYPSDYTPSAKAGADVLFNNDRRRGVSNIGITRIPVRISSVSEYGNLEEVGEKVLSAERQKDGTLRVDLVGSRLVSFGDFEGYEYEYEVKTTRGTKRILSKVAIKDKELYVVTATVSCGKVDTCDAELLEATLPPVRESLSSFRFL